MLAKIPKVVRLAEWLVRKRLLRQQHHNIAIDGFNLSLDLSTEGISRTLAIHRSRERDHTLVFKSEIEPGMRVLDIGANIGYYTMMAAKAVGKNGRVFAIEPDPRNLAGLQRTLAANPALQDIVDLYAFAVSNTVGEATFYQAQASNLNTLVSGVSGVSGVSDANSGSAGSAVIDQFTVQTHTVDAFMQDKGKTINFVRMDIEGFEIEAIEGMLSTLEASPPPCKLLIEVHPQLYNPPARDFGASLEKLFRLGFYPKLVISAGEEIPAQFTELDYHPTRIMREGRFQRGFFETVEEAHAVQLITHVPKLVRYVLLVKK